MRRRGRKLIVACISFLALFLLVFLAPSMLLLGSDPQRQSDVILALAGGRYTAPRLSLAIDLLDQGYARRLIVSGVEYDPGNPNFDPNAWAMLVAITNRYSVLIDTESRITHHSAQYLKATAEREHWTNLMVVTSRFHYGRTRLLFTHESDEPISVIVCTTNDVPFRHWYDNHTSRRLLLRECWFAFRFWITTAPGILSVGMLGLALAGWVLVKRLIP